MGGNAGLSSSQNKRTAGGITTEEGKNTSWSFSPEVGTFLTEHLQLGLGLTLTGSKFDDQDTPTPGITKSNSLGATLYSRYFFGKEAFKPFVGVNVTAAPGKSKYTEGSFTSESETFGFGANINAVLDMPSAKDLLRSVHLGSLGIIRTQRR